MMRFGRQLALGTMALTVMSATAMAGTVFEQGFETDASGIFDQDDGWFGQATRVASGTGNVISIGGSWHAIMTQSGPVGDESGPFSRFDGYRSNWPGTFFASLNVFLDPTALALGEGFDLSIAINGVDGNHRRDFVFHTTMDTSTGSLLIGGSNNTSFDPREDLESINHYAVTTPGRRWMTYQWNFRDMDGVLAVDLSLISGDGTLLFRETRSDASDLIGLIGGNRYFWATNIDVDGGIVVDNLRLNISTLPDPPSVAPLPSSAWAGMAMLGGIGIMMRLRRRKNPLAA